MNRYISSSELKHYGVLGMKWGVRRTPEQLGHKPKYSAESAVIKAGSRVYRITQTKREHKYSDTFVFTDKDDAIKFLSNYKNSPALKEITDVMLELAPQQGITLGVPGEDSDLLKYRAYSIAVAKNFGNARTYAKGGPIEKKEYTFGTFEVATNPKYGMVVDDYMRGNTKLSRGSLEIDSLDTAALIFAKTRESSLKTKKVSKFKHSGYDNTPLCPTLDLWPASGGNSLHPIPLSRLKK